MVHLLNAAMMPAHTGVYQSWEIDATEFATRVRQAFMQKNLKSYIGYPETAQILTDFCNVEIPINRAETKIEHGDTLLIAKLKYRVNNPRTKGEPLNLTIEDFEFRVVEFQSQ